MTGDKEQFNKLDAKDGGHVTFGDNAKGKIIGIGEIDNPQSLSIHWTNLDQLRFGFKRMYKLYYVGVLEVHKSKK